MIEIVDMVQGSEAWHVFRKEHVGASDIPIIMGKSPWKSRYRLYLDKTRDVHEEEKLSPHMIRGNTLEATARSQYEEETYNKVIPKVIIYEEWEIASASLDGITEDGKVIVEIKCPSSPMFLIPEHYMLQVQWQLMISKAERADLFWYIDDVIHGTFSIEPDKGLWEKLLQEAKEFWQLIEEGTPPESTEKDYVFINDAEFDKISLNYIMVNDQLTELTKQKEQLRQQLIDFTDDGNSKGNYLSISKIDGKETIEWKKIASELSIPNDLIKTHTKKGHFYWKINIAN